MFSGVPPSAGSGAQVMCCTDRPVSSKPLAPQVAQMWPQHPTQTNPLFLLLLLHFTTYRLSPSKV